MQGWQGQLERLDQQGMRRRLKLLDSGAGATVHYDGRDLLLLCSNNYLGIAEHPALVEAAVAATRAYGVGSGASRLVSGSLAPHHRLEERLADFKGTAAALLFNSGYAANTGILQGLFGPDDLIFSDALNHASIIDGCRLSGAQVRIYPHGDVESLRALMTSEQVRRRQGRWLIVTDGVFSMDGDLAPLNELCALKEEFEALLMVDDAHGTGVLGDSGRGTAELLGCLERIDLHMGTLGKGFGCAGAYLAAPRSVIDALVNFSRPFIFSTSLPPAVPAAALAALEIVDSDEGAELRRQLERNRALFAGALSLNGLDLLGSCTHIVPILTRDPVTTMRMAESLLKRGLFLQGIRPPTVPEGACRLRATVMASHASGDLRRAAAEIVSLLQEETA